MRVRSIVYWVVTGLFAAFMVLSAIPDILLVPDAVAIIKHLGYPTYLLPFLGVAKVLGSAAVLFPRFPRLKEWAYAGLVFDMAGAVYSHLNVGDGPSVWIFPVIGLTLAAASYILWQSRTSAGAIRIATQETSAATA